MTSGTYTPPIETNPRIIFWIALAVIMALILPLWHIVADINAPLPPVAVQKLPQVPKHPDPSYEFPEGKSIIPLGDMSIEVSREKDRCRWDLKDGLNQQYSAPIGCTADDLKKDFENRRGSFGDWLEEAIEWLTPK